MRNKKLLTLFAFVLCNFILTLIMGVPYFKFVGGYPLEIFFTAVAHISNTSMIYIVLVIVLLLLYFLKFPKIIFIFLFFIVNIMAFIDAGVYKIFRFHINGLVLNTLITQGGWESLDFNTTTEIFIVFVLVSVFFAELFLYNFLSGFFAKKEFVVAKKHVFFIFALSFLVIVIDKGIYTYSDLKNIPYITRHSKLFPLYQPLTIKKFAQKYFNIKIDEAVSFRLDKKYSGLNYPQKKLEFLENQKSPPNIILILMDSFRFDMLDKNITPNIHNFSKKSLVFENHYSGGNCTRFGVFSICYALYGHYWDLMLGERQPPVFMTALADFGYDFKIMAASKLTFPEFNKTCFVNIPQEKIEDEPRGSTKIERDAAMTDNFIKYIDEKKYKKPFFAFLFYDCPHGSYDSPAEFQKFQPAAETFNYLLLSKNNIQPVFNRYKNANHYDDALVGKIIAQLEKSGFLKDTVIIISADHGEAFFEKGFYGHNRGFCEEQVKVPLVFYIPGFKHKKYTNITSHLDIIPTIMSLLGCKNSAGDYSQGISLFGNEKREFVVSYTWDEMAVIDNNSSVVVPLETYNIAGVKIYDGSYRELLDAKSAKSAVSRLAKFQKDLTKFQKW
ncbi:MAG: sulfatase-like hydrolase/transferase [Elusimicrobia bacterium]|nr:sulfatase-like hydrolase/transferase [Elusimicrobiota bacterium]